MKKIFLLLLVFINTVAFAQIPTGYYDSANGNGFTLKTQLKNIINDINDGLSVEYLAVDNGYDGLYTAYQTSDIDNFTSGIYENDGTVLDMYSESESSTMSDPYNFNHTSTDQCGNYTGEGQCYNREHIFPQGFFNELFPMRSDIHFVVPSDGYVNNRRSNYPFGEVSNPTWTSQNGSKVGSNTSSTDYTGNAFEPIDEFKGDIARMLFYFATRYEDQVTSGSWDAHDAASENPLNGTNDQVYEDWYISLLMSWHSADPVSSRELARNNASFLYQNNRNPFIDHPEWVTNIWSSTLDTEAPSVPTNLVASNPTSSTIDLNWNASTDNITVASYDIYIDGENSFNTTSTSFTTTGLFSETNYCFTVYAKDEAGNTSTVSNQSCEITTTQPATGTTCAIETFANIPTGSSSYTSRTWSGDNGFTWNATDARTDQVLNETAITIRNGNITAPTISGGIGSLTVTTQLVFSGSSGTFDLNVNGTLIGNIPYDTNSLTTTISDIDIENSVSIEINNNSSTSNRVIFDDLSWTCYSTLGLDDENISSFKMFPNPIKGNVLKFEYSKDSSIEIFDVLGKKVFNDTINSNKNYIDVSNLNKGIYIIKITSNNTSLSKKLIRQ